MPETTPLIKAALNLRVGAGFDVYNQSRRNLEMARENTSALRRLFFFCRRPADYFFMSKGEKSIVIIKLWSCISIIGFVQFIISNSFFTM